MPESFQSWVQRLGFNLFPAYRGTGARITYLASDWRTVKLRLPLSWRTRNYVGTIFGGSMYGAVDPIMMLILIKNLGPEYVVWLKSAAIRFRKPGRATLFAEFRLDEAELAAIRQLVADKGKCLRVYPTNLVDAAGEVHATIDTVLHIASASAPTEKVAVGPVAALSDPMPVHNIDDDWPDPDA